MKASKFVPRPALVIRGDKDAPTSDTEQEKGGRGQNTALGRQKKLPEIEPKASALIWGIRPESTRKVFGETPDSAFK